MLKATMLKATMLASVTLAMTCAFVPTAYALDPIDIAPIYTPDARTPTAARPMPARLPSHVVLALDGSPAPPEMPGGYTAEQDAEVDAALLLPAIQDAREAARRSQ